MTFDIELILKGASNEQLINILNRNKEIIKSLLSYIPYDCSSLVTELTNNYDVLILNYSRFAYLLGGTQAEYEHCFKK